MWKCLPDVRVKRSDKISWHMGHGLIKNTEIKIGYVLFTLLKLIIPNFTVFTENKWTFLL